MSAPTTSDYLSQTTPAAPSGDQNVIFQSDGATPEQSITAYPQRMVGDSGSGGKAGTVPPPAAGDGAAKKWLKATGAWLAIAAADLAGAIFGASGGSHSAGAVPDPGASSGTTRYLCENATWATPALSPVNADRGAAVAGNGQNVITLGSTPTANSVDVCLNGVSLDPSAFTVSGTTVTYAGAWAAGDVIAAFWLTAGTAAGTITLSTTSVFLRGYAFTNSAAPLTFPVTCLAGDLAVLFSSGSPAIQTAPTGWTVLNNGTTTFYSGGLFYKVLTASDLAAGTVTSSSGIVVEMFVMAGNPGVLDSKFSQYSTSSPVTLTTTIAGAANNTALYFGGCSASSTNSVNRGTLVAGSNTPGSNTGMMYSETLSGAGTVTAIYTMSSGNCATGLVLLGTSVAAGTTPQINPSQIVGGVPVAIALKTNGTANGSQVILNIVSGTNVAIADDGLGNITISSSGGGGGGGGSLVLLESHIASSSTALTFTTRNASGQSGASFQSDFDTYVFELINIVPATNNVTLWIRMSTNGGSTYDAGSNYAYQSWRWIPGGSGATGSASATAITMAVVDAITNTASNGGLCGTMKLFNPLSSTAYKLITGLNNYFNAGAGIWDGETLGGAYKSTTAVNALEFLASSGNLASGTIRLYGIAM